MCLDIPVYFPYPFHAGRFWLIGRVHMARRTESKTVTVDLKIVARRDTLKPRESKEPYWMPLGSGRYLGFRPSSAEGTADGAGTWLARFYDPDTGKKPNKSLGDFATLPKNERFGAAKKVAEEWFTHLAGGGAPESITVADACQRYAKGRPDAEQRFARHVYGDPLARVPLDKLKSHHVKDWRKRLEAKPATLAKRKDGKNPTRERSPASTNRDMVPLRAALNHARDDNFVQTDTAWRVALKPGEANGRRTLYLDKNQRRALLAAMAPDIAAFCRGLCLLPLRPGALAALRVRDFDYRTGVLVIHSDKESAGRRIVLPADTVALFKEQAKLKLPGAPLFTRAGGNAWNKESWKGPVKDASASAGLPAETVAYNLRHSTITDLVVSGLDLLTVAQVAGTSVAMIEKHYGHLQSEHAKQALAGLAL